MEIRVLEYFLAAAREESISRAAEALHVTQPTLSRQLAALEEETGVRLFRRGARGIALTAEGMLLRRRAEEIVELVEQARAELPLQEKEVEGRVALGTGEVAALEILTRMCGTFREKYPKVSFDLYTATADAVRERMERGLVDIGLLLEPTDTQKFDYIRLPVRERYVLLMPPGDPLADREYVTRDDIAGLPLILPERMNVQGELANWFGRDLGELNVAFTGDLKSTKLPAVHFGYGYAIGVEGPKGMLDPDYVAARPLYPALTAGTVLAWKRGQPLGNAAAKFIEHVRCFIGMDMS